MRRLDLTWYAFAAAHKHLGWPAAVAQPVQGFGNLNTV
jgi:hypothetical protein